MAATSRGRRRLSGTHGQAARFIFQCVAAGGIGSCVEYYRQHYLLIMEGERNWQIIKLPKSWQTN